MKEKEPDAPPSSKYEWIEYLETEWQHVKAHNSYLMDRGTETLGMIIGFEVLKSMYPHASTDHLEATQTFYLRLGADNVLIYVDKFLFPGSRIMGAYLDDPMKEEANATQ